MEHLVLEHSKIVPIIFCFLDWYLTKGKVYFLKNKSLETATSKTWKKSSKALTLKVLNYEKRGKQLDAEKKMRRPHDIIY